jgi:hypothetical protein
LTKGEWETRGGAVEQIFGVHTNPTETKRNLTCEKQNEFGFIVSGRPYFLVVDNWELPFALPTSPFLDSF